MLRVDCPAWVIDRFKREAKEYFPKECFAYLYGQLDAYCVTIEGLWFPEGLKQNCAENMVLIEPHWSTEAREVAKEHDAVLVADIHSHPWPSKYLAGGNPPDHSQSQADIDRRMNDWWKLSGICLIKETKTGKLRSSVRFWGPTIPLDVHINSTQTTQRHLNDDDFE